MIPEALDRLVGPNPGEPERPSLAHHRLIDRTHTFHVADCEVAGILLGDRELDLRPLSLRVGEDLVDHSAVTRQVVNPLGHGVRVAAISAGS